SRTCRTPPLPLSMPSVRRWNGPGGCGAQVCHLSGGAAGLTDQQMDGQLHRWGTRLLPSQLLLKLATATPILTSPTPILHGAPSALTCSPAPTPLCPGTPRGIYPQRTRAAPHRNLALMNRLYSPGRGAASPCPTTPRQSARSRWIHRTGRHAARGARRAASPPERRTERPPPPPSPASRAGPRGQWPQSSGRPTD
ncbi:UNVERIFIED_CONTAM: hypothetical protein K2H54_013254, partial [Gekko kuhli]